MQTYRYCVARSPPALQGAIARLRELKLFDNTVEADPNPEWAKPSSPKRSRIETYPR
jgi:hypothetical protein